MIIRRYPNGMVADTRFMTERQQRLAQLSDLELSCEFMDTEYGEPQYGDLEEELHRRELLGEDS